MKGDEKLGKVIQEVMPNVKTWHLPRLSDGRKERG